MRLQIIGLFLSAIFLLASCNDNDSMSGIKESAYVKFKLVDDPIAYDAVLIDVVGLEYKIEADDEHEDEESNSESDDEESESESEDDESGRIADDGKDKEDDDENEGEWVFVDIEPMVYDVLQLQNGAEALLADSEIPAGELKAIRLILGDNNKVVIEGDTIDLMVPSGSSSGLKVKIDAEIESGEFYDVVIDFVASKSIVKTGNGKYLLKPVVKVTLVQDDDPYGSISGVITPVDLISEVHAINASEDTISTTPQEDGTFLLDLLLPGTYSVVIEPADDSGFSDFTLEDVVVKEEEITELENVNFE